MRLLAGSPFRSGPAFYLPAIRVQISSMSDRTIECPSCALPIDPEVDECPYCGYELPRQRSSVKIIALLLVLLLALWLIF